MKFQDLSTYKTSEKEIPPGVHVGWLAPMCSYSQKKPTDTFLRSLEELVSHPFITYRHFEGCPVCYKNKVFETIQGHKKHLGSSHVGISYNGETYYSPDLIYHYVLAHNYYPGEFYEEAVLKGKVVSKPSNQFM